MFSFKYSVLHKTYYLVIEILRHLNNSYSGRSFCLNRPILSFNFGWGKKVAKLNLVLVNTIHLKGRYL